MFVVGGIFTFQTGYDASTNRSAVPFNVGYSTNGSKEIDFRMGVYGVENNSRLFGRLVLKDLPDHYFGIGYDEASNIEQSESTTLYHRTWWQADLNYVHKIRGKLFAGMRVDFNNTRAKDLNSKMEQDVQIIKQGTNIQNSGLGIILQYDTRDFELNARSGFLLSFTSTLYGDPIKSDLPYQIYMFDYRHFKNVQRPGSVISWEIKIDKGSGNIPWTELPKLGTPFNLRGYREGKFRGKSAGFALLEYRHTFRKSDELGNSGGLSKHGGVFWLATGSLGENLSKWNDWLPNFGFGYRFEVQPRINARLDFGFGLKSWGFYINFNEAF